MTDEKTELKTATIKVPYMLIFYVILNTFYSTINLTNEQLVSN